MSGGPVTLQDGSSNLIGIVAGATFDPATGAQSASACSQPKWSPKTFKTVAEEDNAQLMKEIMRLNC